MNRKIFPLLVAALSLVTCGGSAYATLDVRVLDTSIPVGGSSTIDIEISGTGDLVQSFSLELRITPVGSVGSSLQFVGPQTANFRTDTDYVFAGDSFNAAFALDPRSVSQTVLQNDTYVDNDSTNSFSDVAVTSSRLLASVNLLHVIPTGTLESSVLGDTFDISVIGTSRDFAETEFLDSAFTPIAFTSTPGSVTLQPTAVPEPSSIALLTLGTGAIAWRRRRRRMREG